MAIFENILRTILVRIVASPLTQPRLPKAGDPEERKLYAARLSTWGRETPKSTRSFLTDVRAPAENDASGRCARRSASMPASMGTKTTASPQELRHDRGECCLPQIAPLPTPRGLLACSATPAPRGRRHGKRPGR